jgi:hypothetical protein
MAGQKHVRFVPTSTVVFNRDSVQLCDTSRRRQMYPIRQEPEAPV